MIEHTQDSPEPWYNQPIHFIDFEGSHRSGILEYGMVTIQDLDVVAMETRLCCGIGPIPEMETATHQIREEDVLSLAPISESWELFRDKRASGPFGAHHAGVENGLIKSVWPYTTPCPNYITDAIDVDWGPWLDTCALYRSLFPGLESYNLAALIEAFKLMPLLNNLSACHCPPTRNVFHCAAYDALASAVLVIHLKHYEELHALSLPQLLQWSQPSDSGNSMGNQMELL